MPWCQISRSRAFCHRVWPDTKLCRHLDQSSGCHQRLCYTNNTLLNLMPIRLAYSCGNWYVITSSRGVLRDVLTYNHIQFYREDPYNGMKAIEVIPRVLKGERPQITEGCDPLFKQLMDQCWLEDPEKRPSFRHIVDTLDNYYEELLQHIARNASLSPQGTASPVTSPSNSSGHNSSGSVSSLHSWSVSSFVHSWMLM